MKTNLIAHENPVWRDRANFIIIARIDLEPTVVQGRWEQLWTQQITDNRFILCCIPFFIYDLALGDEVETSPQGKNSYVMQRVVNPSGHYTFRVWFHDPGVRGEVARELDRQGCLVEWRSISGNLLAIDAASDSQAQEVADLLWHREQSGCLTYETGRTKPSNLQIMD